MPPRVLCIFLFIDVLIVRRRARFNCFRRRALIVCCRFAHDLIFVVVVSRMILIVFVVAH